MKKNESYKSATVRQLIQLWNDTSWSVVEFHRIAGEIK